MFVIDDFLDIMKYLQDDTSVVLDPKLATAAKNEQGKSVSYVDNMLIPAFTTSDTLKLFNFFIDWYASHKTIISTSRNVSDVYSMPSAHIDELFASFGFDNENALRNLSPITKPELFKDLVELYKKKGTPEALFKILSYFEVDLVALYEYYLYKNSSGDLVFRRKELYRSLKFAEINNSPDIDFDDITQYDPHWLLTKDQIHQSIARNGYGLPSKTPYIGIVPSINFNQFVPYMAYVNRYSQDKYYSGDTTTRDIVTSIGVTVSYIELYLGAVYAFLKEYPMPIRTPLYTSDFSVDANNWSGINSTVTGDVGPIGGLNDWLRITCDNTYSQHYASYDGALTTVGQTYKVSFKYYIPSGQSHVAKIIFVVDAGTPNFTDNVMDTVCEVNTVLKATYTGKISFGGFSYDGNAFIGDNNAVYIKDIVVTEIENFTCYNGTAPYTLDSVTTEYNNIIEVKPDRNDRNSTIIDLYTAFSRLETTDFIRIEGGAEAYLTRLNPAFKDEIDIYFDGNRANEVISLLISDLVTYYKNNFDRSYSPLGMFMLDFGAFQKEYINDIINFFKPYHARMQFVEKFISVGNVLEESIYMADQFEYPIEDATFYDFCTGDGHPSFYNDEYLTNNYYSREHYDSTAYFDAGVLFDNLELSIDIEHTINDIINYYPGDLDRNVENEYILDDLGNVIQATSSSIGCELDVGWISDAPFISDYFKVVVEDLIPIDTYDDILFWWGLENEDDSLLIIRPTEDYPGTGTLSYPSGTPLPQDAVSSTYYKVGSGSLRLETAVVGDMYIVNNSGISGDLSQGKCGFWVYFDASWHDHTCRLYIDVYDTVTQRRLTFSAGQYDGIGPILRFAQTIGYSTVMSYAYTTALTVGNWHYVEFSWDSSIFGWDLIYKLDTNIIATTYNEIGAAGALNSCDNIAVSAYIGYTRNSTATCYMDNLMISNDRDRDLESININVNSPRVP